MKLFNNNCIKVGKIPNIPFITSCILKSIESITLKSEFILDLSISYLNHLEDINYLAASLKEIHTFQPQKYKVTL